jgi:hypothetical protein
MKSGFLSTDDTDARQVQKLSDMQTWLNFRLQSWFIPKVSITVMTNYSLSVLTVFIRAILQKERFHAVGWRHHTLAQFVNVADALPCHLATNLVNKISPNFHFNLPILNLHYENIHFKN